MLWCGRLAVSGVTAMNRCGLRLAVQVVPAAVSVCVSDCASVNSFQRGRQLDDSTPANLSDIRMRRCLSENRAPTAELGVVDGRSLIIIDATSRSAVNLSTLTAHLPFHCSDNMSGVSHRGVDPSPDEPHGAADPNRNAFRSFWTAPAGPERPPQGMYDYDPSYKQPRTTPGAAITQHSHDDHSHHIEHDEVGHSHGDGGHGHSHGGGHGHRLDESAPLLGSSGSSNQQRSVLGVFASYQQLLCCLIPALIVLALLGYFLFRGSSSPPASAPVIIPPPPPSITHVAAYCNPFALVTQSVDIAHNHGLVAYLYLLPADSLSSPPDDTAGYRSAAANTNSTFFFSALDTPTRLFTRSFAARNESSGEEQLMPSQYFLLSFHTVLQPPRTGGAGEDGSEVAYQLALISDDGSVLYGADVAEASTASSGDMLIDNDGVHTTRVAFSEFDPSNSTAITAGRTTNLTLHYFQGPPAHIALQLLYRPIDSIATHTVNTTNSTQTDDEDETDDAIDRSDRIEEQQQQKDADEEGNGLYWEVRDEGTASVATERYKRLVERGWQVVPDDWYWLPQWYEGKDDVDSKVAAGVDPCL